jgi:hypothetical protein
MTPEQFIYWLQGHCEMNPDTLPTYAQWEMIKEHLQSVFKKPLTEVKQDVKIDTTDPLFTKEDLSKIFEKKEELPRTMEAPFFHRNWSWPQDTTWPYYNPNYNPNLHPTIIC